ncbi:hypothetical protein [Streptomyces sp. NPDC002490]|uniref:hypothetical protein n=1 Tax=Streptomyces sp. NPDC002490 TaxID=3154416 RepID=UPI003329D9DE
MTAPLTPPPQDRPPARGDGGHPPAAPFTGDFGDGAESGPGKAAELRVELRDAAVIALVLGVAGALLGLLWLWWAPRVPLVSDAEAVYLGDTEGEQAIGIDGTFTLLAVAFGLASAAVVFWLRRRGGVPLVVGLALGGLLGSLLAWRLGVWLGPTQNVVEHAKEVGKGVTFDAPLRLGARGALLVWPVTALLAHLCLTALFGPRDPDPYLAQHPYGTPQWDRGPAGPSAATGPGAADPYRAPPRPEDPFAPPPDRQP